MAWSNKGSALIGQGKYDEAVKGVREAIRLDPNICSSLEQQRCGLSMTSASPTRPYRHLTSQSGWTPKMPTHGTTKALLSVVLGKYDEAVKAFDRAIEINPQDSAAWKNKGVTLKALGKTKEADAAFARARELGQ